MTFQKIRVISLLLPSSLSPTSQYQKRNHRQKLVILPSSLSLPLSLPHIPADISFEKPFSIKKPSRLSKGRLIMTTHYIYTYIYMYTERGAHKVTRARHRESSRLSMSGRMLRFHTQPIPRQASYVTDRQIPPSPPPLNPFPSP